MVVRETNTKNMKQFVNWMWSSPMKCNPVELPALAHHRLLHIHPLIDVNGRTVRLLINLILMQQVYPLVAILKNDRKKYYDILDRGDRGKLDTVGAVHSTIRRKIPRFVFKGTGAIEIEGIC
jgi:Fic family protein